MKFHFLIYLAVLSILGFLATDMYLPAFETMRQDLGTSKNLISSSLTLFLGGFAAAQLLWGPFSDKYGKPNAILLGLSIFIISSIGIFYTHNIYIFLGLRVLQAIGVCATAVSWQALVIERYPAEQTSKVFGIPPSTTSSIIGNYFLKLLFLLYFLKILWV